MRCPSVPYFLTVDITSKHQDEVYFQLLSYLIFSVTSLLSNDLHSQKGWQI